MYTHVNVHTYMMPYMLRLCDYACQYACACAYVYALRVLQIQVKALYPAKQSNQEMLIDNTVVLTDNKNTLENQTEPNRKQINTSDDGLTNVRTKRRASAGSQLP